MWVLTSFGVLMPALRKPGTIPKGDNRVMQIRARRLKDLEILREQYMGENLGPVVHNAGTDYEFRAYCTRAAWAKAMADMSLDIDYHSFKDTTETKYGDRALHDLYMTIWGALLRGLTKRPYGSKASYNSYESSNPIAPSYLTRRESKHDRGNWWDDLNDLPPRTLSTVLDSIVDTSEVDLFTDGPDMRPNGTLDHSMCDHGSSRTARKRCRKAWLKNQS